MNGSKRYDLACLRWDYRFSWNSFDFWGLFCCFFVQLLLFRRRLLIFFILIVILDLCILNSLLKPSLSVPIVQIVDLQEIKFNLGFDLLTRILKWITYLRTHSSFFLEDFCIDLHLIFHFLPYPKSFVFGWRVLWKDFHFIHTLRCRFI